MTQEDDHLAWLSRTKLFAGLDTPVLRRIVRFAKEVDHGDGHTIVLEGHEAQAMHVIIEGAAVVTIGGREVARLGPGDSFGEVALFDHGPRTATVTASGPLRVLALDGSRFLQLVHSDGDLAVRLLSHLARFLRGLDGELAECRFGRVLGVD